MKKLLFLLLIFILPLSVFAGRKDFIEVTHFSQVLNKNTSYMIYIPENKKEDVRFPVLYVLHGANGSYNIIPEKTGITELAERYQMILVFPDGGQYGWYVDSPIEKYSQYETYIVDELIKEIDRLYPTLDDKKNRGVMGYSMGGHGALLLAAKHPDLFGSASSMSGILKISDHPEKWHVAGRLGGLEKNRKAWEENSVWEQAKNFRKADIRIMFDCGEKDTYTGAIQDSRKLHERLVKLKVPHIWRELPGTHSWSYWTNHMEEHLDFHQSSMYENAPLNWFGNMYFKRIAGFYDENLESSIKKEKKGIKVCLLGSSSVQGFQSSLLPDYTVFNRGISADRLGVTYHGLSHRLEVSVFDMKPDYVFILNGRNDLAHLVKYKTVEIPRLMEEYEKIITGIRERLPETEVCIITCPPVRDKYEYLKDAVYDYNEQLRLLASRIDAPLLDLYPLLVDDEKRIKPEYTGDGLHMTNAAKEIWAGLMDEFIKESSNDNE